MKFNKILFFTIAAAFLSTTALPARAAILPACATDVTAVLQLSCFLTLLIGVSQFILGLTGSLALLFFVYGGFLFLTSGGKSDQVQKGKTILTQATIGIIIIFGAYLAVSFLVANVLGAKFTTDIPKETTPAAAPATGLPSAGAKCTDCTCFDAGSYVKIGGTYSNSAACSAECKNRAYITGGYCPSLAAPPGSSSGCKCFCLAPCNCLCKISTGMIGGALGFAEDSDACNKKCEAYGQEKHSCTYSSGGGITINEVANKNACASACQAKGQYYGTCTTP